MSIETAQAIQSEIARSRYYSAPDRDWKELVQIYYSAGKFAEATSHVIRTDGSIENISADDAAARFYELREEMATSAHGAWFAATVTITADGRFRYEFDYDNEPDWEVSPSDETYLDDLEAHPRPVDEIPAWHPGHPSKAG